MKKYVLCPPCGTMFEEENEEELVRVTQAHAKEKHGYSPTRDDVLATITSAPSQSE